MKTNIEVPPFIYSTGDNELKQALYSKSFDVKHIGNIKGLLPIIGVDFNETEQSYGKRLKLWKLAENDVLFEGWKIKDMKHWHFITSADKKITFIFEFSNYTTVINDREYKFPSLPDTIDDFINDCRRIGIKLFWKQEIIDKFGVDKLSSQKKMIDYSQILRQTLD